MQVRMYISTNGEILFEYFPAVIPVNSFFSMSKQEVVLPPLKFVEMRRELVRKFSSNDIDRNARLDREEFAKVMAEMGFADEAHNFDLADTNRDGTIDLKEFLALCEALINMKNEGDVTGFLKIAFKAADANGNGAIDREEFKQFCKILAVDVDLFKEERIWRNMDSDHNGKITLDEILSNFVFLFK